MFFREARDHSQLPVGWGSFDVVEVALPNLVTGRDNARPRFQAIAGFTSDRPKILLKSSLCRLDHQVTRHHQKLFRDGSEGYFVPRLGRLNEPGF